MTQTLTQAPAPDTQLRILATTDIHMNITGFDYAADRTGRQGSLAALATLIAKARAQAGPDCVLVDNGDFLQGTPLADWLSAQKEPTAHPLADAFNTLTYDAIGLGNHDLDYARPYLERFIAATDAPVISTNFCQSGIKGLQPFAIARRQVGPKNQQKTVTIGIVSALPLETAVWNKAELPPGTLIENPTVALRRTVEQLREDGVDLVIALAHMGLGQAGDPRCSGDAGALALAGTPGIDAVIAGHTHLRHPEAGNEIADLPPDRPVVMPGWAGSDLGVIDLQLAQDADKRWRVAQHRSQLWTVTPDTVQDPQITRLAAPAHAHTRETLDKPIGKTCKNLHSYFALLQPSSAMALNARAKAIVVKNAVQGSIARDLPILSAATARCVGGAGGPRNYIDIPAGPILRRQLTGFAPFTNRICAVILNGRQVKQWLERSALVYTHLSSKTEAQMLLCPDAPAFTFDSIYGLHYKIDPTQPAGQRISDVTQAGSPIEGDQQFVLATNHFRAAGGCGYNRLDLPDPLLQTDVTSLNAIESALHHGGFDHWEDAKPWQIKRHGVRAIFETGPSCHRYLDEIDQFQPTFLGQSEGGFERLNITL